MSLTQKVAKSPSYFDAILPLICLICVVASSVYFFGLEAMSGPLQVGILIIIMLTIFILLKNGHAWDEISQAGQRGIASITGAIFILLSVGALIAAWNLSGTIPTLIYYGIKTISPNWFYPIAFFICGVTSLSIGSSWTTAGTIGVGLVGLASMLGLSPEITAGAVISGAYVGDKLSPLSETALLSAQINDVPIYEHISFQARTTIPTAILALILFLIVGVISEKPNVDAALLEAELSQFEAIYRISIWNLIPLLFLIILSILRIPAVLAILLSALFACFMSIFLQPDILIHFAQKSFNETATTLEISSIIKSIWLVLAKGFSIETGLPEMDALLSRGGMHSMLITIWLILVAITFGTLVDEFGLLNKLVTPILVRAKSTPKLIVSVVLTALGLNATAGDQYIALLIPSRLFKKEFTKRGLENKLLSRTVADASIVTSPLVAWNSCGAYMAAVLGVSTLSYMPFAFFNILAPLMSVAFALLFYRAPKKID
ncbi:Na+/H+ antiporter NhaC family protein [Thorsellia anophelis]|uniref:Transporter, NhaC family (TC 2.A.35) n=1 Tax=Thorsellia anophelis DSM 18579 TaxID=1123402 RepID=A0A1I0E6C8_9GAMM|nr:Na+/H+ antiporter NhaC family protein [Thorsellia anophelis]SET40604.1 transporter, NhaC family (TC 2.A.35) [Thorsellia anophelis DSM 18579]